ncbi:MAG: serine hydrolase [Planctomycetota bacterium]
MQSSCIHVWCVVLSLLLMALDCNDAVAQQKWLPDEFATELKAKIQRVGEETPVPGLAIAIIDSGGRIQSSGFGFSDLESKSKVNPSDTIFQIGSISKSFTATLAAQLESEGKLSWDEPLSKSIANLDLPSENIRLKHLAQHTSGLPGDAPNLRRKHGDYPILAFTHFELYRGLESSTVHSRPGERWSYSNFGYAVFGHVLELKTKTPYETLVKQRVFDPLNMDSSTITIWPELQERLATPYHLVDGKLVKYDCPWDQEALAPAGGIASTVDDMAKYAVFQLQSNALKDEVGRLQIATVETGGNPYGKGWFNEQIPGLGTVVSVGGDVDGYVGEVVLAPKKGIGCVILVNSGDAPFLQHLGRWVLTRLQERKTGDSSNERLFFEGMMAQSIKDWPTAIQLLSAACESSSHQAASYQIGKTAAISGQFTVSGKKALKQYLTGKPLQGISRAAAYWRLGMICENSGQLADARESYEKSLELDANFLPAKTALDKLNYE